jgi:hypothetical protein
MGAVEFRSHARALRDLTSSLEPAARRQSALCWDKVGQVASAFFKLPSMSLSQRSQAFLLCCKINRSCRTSKYSASTGASLSMDAAYPQKPPNCGSYFAGDFSNNCFAQLRQKLVRCAFIARCEVRRTFDRLSVGKIRNRIVTLKGDAVFMPHSSTGAEIPYSRVEPNERFPPASA